MFGRSSRPDSRQNEGEASEPLLNNSRDDLRTPDDRVVFSVDDDDDDDDGTSGHEDPDHGGYSDGAKPPHRVRFHEEVRVVAPSLRSTEHSREAGMSSLPTNVLLWLSGPPEYELDDDELDETSLAALAADNESPRLSRHRDQRMPLLLGLADAAAIRRSSDGTISMAHLNGNGTEETQGPDLEALAAKSTAGGGMLDSIANMANSILGAGSLAALLYSSYAHIRSNRNHWYANIAFSQVVCS